MSNKKETPILDFLNKFFSKFFDTLTVCVKNICVLGAILGSIGLICFTILNFSSNKPFAKSDSRLERQIDTILNEYSGSSPNGEENLSGDQRTKLIQTLIDQYDAATDNLDPTVNPNASPMDLESILSKFEINGDVVLPRQKKDDKPDW